jgi:hypothetical protein
MVEIQFKQDLFSNRLNMGNILGMGQEVRLSTVYKIFVATCQVENEEGKSREKNNPPGKTRGFSRGQEIVRD